MFRSSLYRRIVVSCAFVSALAAGLAASSMASFLLGFLGGAVAGGSLGWFVAHAVGRERRLLSDTLRDGVFDSSVRAAGGRGDAELEEVVQSVIGESRRRVNEFARRLAELEQDSELLKTVLGTMVEGVLVVDVSEQVLFANAAVRSLLNIERRDVIGRPLVEVVREPRIREAAQRVSAAHEAVHSEFEIGRQKKTVALSAAALGSSRFQGVVLVLHDISEIRRLERLRRDFVSNVSHELKTPLTSIQAYADTLLDGALEDSAHNRTFLERIVQQSERLQSLIVDLLSLAKIESQSEVFEILPVSVDAAIRACAEAHLAVAKAKGITLEWTTDSGLAVMSDPDGLAEILDNLVDNALNYTPGGGRVAVSARREGDWGVVMVEDTGIGISREQQSRIFERFYRADRARSRAVGGTGLGLAIVKHLAQAFGGNVRVESELGRGSLFEVRIAAAPIMERATN